MIRQRRGRLGVVLALCAAVVIAGCGDEDDNDDVTPGGSAAMGPPIAIGFVSTENSPAGDYAGSRQGAEAAARYVNEELGGIGGRPIELDLCVTDGGPESSIRCANTFVQEGKVAVMHGVDLGAGAAMPIYNEAGMPVFPTLPVNSEEFTSPTSFAFVGGAPAAIAGIASYAATGFEADNAAVLAVDVPASRAAYENFFVPVVNNLGVSNVDLVFESATTADLTPAMTRANQSEPDVISVGFGEAGCGAAMRAAQSLAIDPAKLVFVQECASEEVISAGSGGGEGAAYQSPYLSPDSDEPNVVLYREKMGEYAPDAAISVATLGGFNHVMNFYEAMKNSTAEPITSETIVQTFKSATDVPGFASHAFTCDGQQLTGFPAVCDTNIRILRYENGEFTDVAGDWVNGVEDLTP